MCIVCNNIKSYKHLIKEQVKNLSDEIKSLQENTKIDNSILSYLISLGLTEILTNNYQTNKSQVEGNTNTDTDQGREALIQGQVSVSQALYPWVKATISLNSDSEKDKYII